MAVTSTPVRLVAARCVIKNDARTLRDFYTVWAGNQLVSFAPWQVELKKADLTPDTVMDQAFWDGLYDDLENAYQSLFTAEDDIPTSNPIVIT